MTDPRTRLRFLILGIVLVSQILLISIMAGYIAVYLYVEDLWYEIKSLLYGAIEPALPERFRDRGGKSTEGALTRYLSRTNHRLINGIETRTPPWIEHFSGWAFLISSDRGMDTLDKIIEYIPAKVMESWRHFGVLLMTTYVFIWAILKLSFSAALLIAGAGALYLLSQLDAETILKIFAAGVEISTQQAEYVANNPEVIVLVLGMVLGGIMLWVILYNVIIIPVLPEVVLHELGHYAAIRYANGTVKSYGLLLYGPSIAGAFVEEHDISELSDFDRRAAYSAGIANSFLWGVLLTVIGFAWIGFDPSPVIELVAKERSFNLSQDISLIVIFMGVMGVLNSFGNAFPAGPVDGGLYMNQLLKEYWRFDTALEDI